MKKLTKNKIKFIVDNFFEKYDIDFKKFEKLKSPEELHFLAEIYNWDYDITVLRKIIQSPYCDKGTALMLFWRGCPEDTLTLTNNIEPDELNLIKEIQEKFLKDSFKTKIISYDPSKDNLGDAVSVKNEKIDSIFYLKTEGDKFPNYEWSTSEIIQRKLTTQEKANGLVNIEISSITIDNVNDVNQSTLVCTNENELEKQILFPMELWNENFQYTTSTNSWSCSFRLEINNECNIKNIDFLVGDNKVILDCINYLPDLKFKKTKSNIEIIKAEAVVTVKYSVNRFIEKTKEEIEMDKIFEQIQEKLDRDMEERKRLSNLK